MSERAGQRIGAAVGVVVRYEGNAEPCLSQSVSPRGMAIATQRMWPARAELEVEIVHQGARLRARARIVNQGAGSIGVEYMDPTPEFQRAMQELLANLVGGAKASRAEPPESLREVAWSVAQSAKGLASMFRGRHHKARLMDVTLDGAAIMAKNPPGVGDEVLIHLPNHVAQSGEERSVQSTARVVRHTEHGFAVQFVSPSTAFRRVISEIRKASRG